MKNTAIVILAIGLLFTMYTSFNFVTREKVVETSHLEIIADKNNYLTWSPLLGIAIIVLGGGVLLFGTKKTIN